MEDYISTTDSITTADGLPVLLTTNSGQIYLPRPPKRRPKSSKNIKLIPMKSSVLSLVHHFDSKPLKENENEESDELDDKTRGSMNLQQHLKNDSILNLPILSSHTSTDSIDSFAHQIHEEVRINMIYSEEEENKDDTNSNLPVISGSPPAPESTLTSTLVKYGIGKRKIRESIEMEMNCSIEVNNVSVCARILYTFL